MQEFKKGLFFFWKIFRKHVSPKMCARKFTKYCDLDKDGEISAREWVTCLGIDISSKFILQPFFQPHPCFCQDVGFLKYS